MRSMANPQVAPATEGNCRSFVVRSRHLLEDALGLR
jgi:hypothetical protein